MSHFALNKVFYLTHGEVHMHTSLQFGQHSENQLFQSLHSAP